MASVSDSSRNKVAWRRTHHHGSDQIEPVGWYCLRRVRVWTVAINVSLTQLWYGDLYSTTDRGGSFVVLVNDER